MYEQMCLVLNLGGGQSASIARKVRSLEVYSEVLPADAPVDAILKRAPRALIVAGGEGNPFRDDAPRISEAVYALGLPMLGLGGGAGVLLKHAGARAVRSMPGRQTVEVSFEDSPLFEGLTDSERYVERIDQAELPEGCRSIASMGDWSIAFEDDARKHWGVQFYPEQNDPDGMTILSNFVVGICGCARTWTMAQFLEEAPEHLRAQANGNDVVMAISGGVDSAVCAALMHKAIGDHLKCVYVDTGLMRRGDNDAVRFAFEKMPGLTLSRIDVRDRFLEILSGVTDASEKRRRIKQELMQVFHEYAQSIGHAVGLARGTTYDDVLEGGPAEGDEPAVGSEFSVLISPARQLFKDEVRQLGEAMGLPEEFIRRQAFPDTGLALRCLGEVTSDKLKMLREADLIYRDEIVKAGLSRKIRQHFAVLTDMVSPGADDETGYTLALRAVNWTGAPGVATIYRLPYDLLERVTERVTGEVKGINRVVYDVTGKPPARIEWE